MNLANLEQLIELWKSDKQSTYQTWFLWAERLKNFRSIRVGIKEVILQISDDEFGNAYRGSSLETVVHSIAEQKQMFKGADHAFLWKPKLRIPDIYEDRRNQKAFGKFLDTCLECCTEDEIKAAIHHLDEIKIKGLGPAAANLLYFLHPTIMPPFNTAIVKGYNLITGSKVKLGKWTEYLAMREGILRLNSQFREQLSNDLGAITAFLFDVGSERLEVPVMQVSEDQWQADLEKVRMQALSLKKKPTDNDATHTEVQGWLRDLGLELGYQVWIASNDRGRVYRDGKLSDGCIENLEATLTTNGGEMVKLIDVLWLSGTSIIAGFEVEHTTSIYSGILRLLDLAHGELGGKIKGIYLVAPNDREEEIKNQVSRPAFQRISDLNVRFLPYDEFSQNRIAMGKFGEGIKAIEAISKVINGKLKVS